MPSCPGMFTIWSLISDVSFNMPCLVSRVPISIESGQPVSLYPTPSRKSFPTIRTLIILESVVTLMPERSTSDSDTPLLAEPAILSSVCLVFAANAPAAITAIKQMMYSIFPNFVLNIIIPIPERFVNGVQMISYSVSLLPSGHVCDAPAQTANS